MRRGLPWFGVMAIAGCATVKAPGPRAEVPTAVPSAEAATNYRAVAPSLASAVPVEPPVPEVVKLENGLELRLLTRPGAPIALRWVQRRALEDERPTERGIGVVAVSALTHATKRRGARELAEAVETLGTTLEGWATREALWFGMEALPLDLDAALALLAEVLREPRLDTESLERGRRDAHAELDAVAQSAPALASRIVRELAWGEFEGGPVAWRRSTLRALDLRTLRRFYTETIRPETAALVLVGDVDRARGEALARRHFGSFPSASARSGRPSGVIAPKRGVFVVERAGAAQTALALMWPSPPRGAGGEAARGLAGLALGGLFTSRLNQSLREDHAYTYGVAGSFTTNPLRGAYFVTTSVETAATGAAYQAILDETVAAQRSRPLTDAELARARAAAVDGVAATLLRSPQGAARLGDEFVEHRAADFGRSRALEFERVTLDDLRAAMRSLDPAAPTVVMVGDRSAIEAQLRERHIAFEALDVSRFE